MNTLSITPLADGKVRVTIRSEGERDQHVDLDLDELKGQIGAVDQPASDGGASTETYRKPEPPAVGEPPTTTPSNDA